MTRNERTVLGRIVYWITFVPLFGLVCVVLCIMFYAHQRSAAFRARCVRAAVARP
jgi:hypothetical protein